MYCRKGIADIPRTSAVLEPVSRKLRRTLLSYLYLSDSSSLYVFIATVMLRHLADSILLLGMAPAL